MHLLIVYLYSSQKPWHLIIQIDNMTLCNKKYLVTTGLATLLLLGSLASISKAQVKSEGGKTTIDGKVELDKIIHDFGDVLLTDGTLKCSFNVNNISGKPMAIYNVVSSCGCTDVSWSREPILAGKSGKISAAYTNNDGPYPFDKTLTVYFSNLKKPVILRLRGTVHSKKKSLEELYPVRFGDIGFKSVNFSLGNLSRGNQRGDIIDIANLSGKPVRVTLTDISAGLKAEIHPNPIPAKSVSHITYTVTAEKGKFGRNLYYISPLVNGKPCSTEIKGEKVSKISISTFIKEDFSGWTQSMKDKAAKPVFETSNYSIGKVKKGEYIQAAFNFTNKGKSPLEIYKAETDSEGAAVEAVSAVPAGKSGIVKVNIDTGKMPSGEVLIVISLVTNTPIRPVITLFISGAIE